MINRLSRYLRTSALTIHWPLLLFLLMIMDVKMAVKVAALVIFLVRDYKIFTDKNIFRRSHAWFYAIMAGMVMLHMIISFTFFNPNYLVAAGLGLFYWICCILAAVILQREINRTDTGTLHNTISLFLILNISFTALQLLLIMIDAGSVNPFTYQGMQQKYFIGTGDLLTGITMDVSTTNAVICSMGIIYCLHRKQWVLTLLCMACLLVTASNITFLLLLLVFVFMFIFRSTKLQKSIITVCLFGGLVFMTKVSPQNNTYVKEAWGKMLGIKKTKVVAPEDLLTIKAKPDSALHGEEIKQKKAMLALDSVSTAVKTDAAPVHITPVPTTKKELVVSNGYKPVLPKDNIHTQPFQRRHDTSSYQRELLSFAVTTRAGIDTSLKKTKSRRVPGKIIALEETIAYLNAHPLQWLIGAGCGNFSSKLAFRTTALGISGGYPERFKYIHPAFLENHLALYLEYFSKDIEIHSVINNPNSVYNQLLSEYGLAGIGVFLVFYAGYFIRQTRKNSYALPLLLFLLGTLAVEYWFEQLSIVILFECMMLIHQKEKEAGHG